MTQPYTKQLYTLTGGKLEIASVQISATIIRGTIDVTPSDSTFVLSLYLGDVVYGKQISQAECLQCRAIFHS